MKNIVIELLEDIVNIQGLANALNMLLWDMAFPFSMSKENAALLALAGSIEEKASRVRDELEERVKL